MIQLQEINEDNWLATARLSATEEQQHFLDCPLGIIARGYVYRNCNARVFAISTENDVVGVALVKDMDEEPACYDLQQFMIDKCFQNKGYGTEALKQILTLLESERKYECVEVCVNKTDLPALHVYEKLGFADTKYIDDAVPDCLNLMYHFSSDLYHHTDRESTEKNF